VRSGNLFSNRSGSVLDAPEHDRAQKRAGTSAFKRKAAVTEIPLRRENSYAETFGPDYTDDLERQFSGRSRRGGVRLSFRGGVIPKTLFGRIAAGVALLGVAAAGIYGAVSVHKFLLVDEHFRVADSASIQIVGKSRLTTPQLLSIFGEDVDQNIFRIPLEERRAELESLPWVAHATVMRLLPNRLQVAVVERTPVAFVRAGTHIGLVDVNGVLFDVPDMQAGTPSSIPHYSFPVLTGISESDPLSTRAARMKLYVDFLAGLDAGGEKISTRVSEVDVSNPDDVKAIVPDENSQSTNVLVHFGAESYLGRYQQYQEHLAEWRTQCPRLASVDMRYDQQVVLEPCTPSGEGAVSTASAEPLQKPLVQVSAAAVAKPKLVAPKRKAAIKRPRRPAHAAAHAIAPRAAHGAPR
jgi:cell division protein FtsQ